jgi:hypothetical protein
MWAGGVKPCFFKHASSEVRLVVEPLVGVADDAEVEVVLVELAVLLPQAAITRDTVIAVNRSNSRDARRRILVVVCTGSLSSFGCRRDERVLGARLNMHRMSRSHLCGARKEPERLLSAHNQALPS